jgi:hypothetical protein
MYLLGKKKFQFECYIKLSQESFGGSLQGKNQITLVKIQVNCKTQGILGL